MEALTSQNIPGGGSNGQTLEFISSTGGYVTVGLGAGGALNATDVTNLTNAMATDIAAQMNAKIATPQGWVTGQP